jgi:organic radical activating enzyme
MSPQQCSVEQALFTLQHQPDLPKRLAHRLHSQWEKLTPRLQAIDPSFQPPQSGYFSTIRGDWASLYSQHKAMTVPVSVFGAPGNDERSVISCLYDIKDDDIAKHGKLQQYTHSQPSIPLYHVTTLSNFIKGYDKYSRRYSKDSIPESTFADKFFLLHAYQLPTGVEKASKLLRKLDIKDDTLIVLHTEVSSSQDSDSSEEDDVLVPHPKGQYVRRNWISITDLSILPVAAAEGWSSTSTCTLALEGISVEEAAARSLRLQHPMLQPYQNITPRSVSIMPIAKGCQAKCPFCFSKGSVSDDMRQQRMYEDKVEEVLQAALTRGAVRAVITGGGEPFMLPFPRMLALITQCSAKFSTVCAISNGYSLSQLSTTARMEALRDLDKAGLTVLSLSRHAVSEYDNEKIMWLKTESHKVADTWREAMDSDAPLASLTRLRWVCVLQKGGVDSLEQLHAYMTFVAHSGANEVCFKELYVSTTVESVYHDHASNVWSTQHQVPLSLVIDFCECESNGFERVGELPWGAPLYQGVYNGRTIKVAAYTEPSVFWERAHGLCRSWNYMANGEVLASLEDKNSQVDIASLV